jgi:hypothetical protein
MSENLRAALSSAIAASLPAPNKKPIAEFRDSQKLSDLGLDSLGFSLTIARMEGEFGVDPFSTASEILYPETFGEMLSLYDKSLSTSQSDRKAE